VRPQEPQPDPSLADTPPPVGDVGLHLTERIDPAAADALWRVILADVGPRGGEAVGADRDGR
jgi:hypothetical protein